MRVGIDCNIFDKLIEDENTVALIQELIKVGEIEIYLSPTVLIELEEAEEKHGIKLCDLIDYKLIDESTSNAPFIPGKAVIGGCTAHFEQLIGNKTAAKTKKDPRIFATMAYHDVEYFVTENKSDFRSDKGVEVISFSKFKNICEKY